MCLFLSIDTTLNISMTRVFCPLGLYCSNQMIHSSEKKRNELYRASKVKDTDSTVAKRGSVFIGLMTPNGAIWSRYQRAVLMRRLSYLCRMS